MGDGPACSALVDVAALSLASLVLARAWRNLKCFHVVFKASFCSCRAPPIPSEEAELPEEAGSLFPGPHHGSPEARGWPVWSPVVRHGPAGFFPRILYSAFPSWRGYEAARGCQTEQIHDSRVNLNFR
uniref:Secreted protein n=1 Tax=Rousettus aegyptiacus TaxID=9407 RepID=A0A7J8C2H4_ROUAE|nr:hypothetical protein HJG63_009371 [Rousettus aegyptiacus]